MKFLSDWFFGNTPEQLPSETPDPVVSQHIIQECSDDIALFIWNNMFVKNESRLYSDKVDFSAHKALLLSEKMNSLPIPISALNEKVGEQVIELVVSSYFSQSAVDFLAFFLDQGYQVNDKMLLRLEKYQTITHKSHIPSVPVLATEQASRFKMNEDNMIKVLDLLTSFGAKWDTASTTDLQYPTVLDYLYHNLKNDNHQKLTEYLKGYYQNREPQQNGLLNSDVILRKRMEQLFADDTNDIMIETGEDVKVSVTPKTKRTHS